MQKLFVRPRFVKRLLCVFMIVILVISIVGKLLVQASETPPVNGPAWTTPNNTTIRRVSALSSIQNQPNLLSNLGCSPLTYRMVNSSSMRTGCFTSTAFGMLDSDNETIIFNGTDEGLRLLPYSANQLLEPWPSALNLVTLDAANTGGSYIGLYKNPVSVSQDQRDFTGQLSGKKLGIPPELSLKDPNGQPLIINPQTLAFSDGGSWLVAETLGSSFVRINLASLALTAFAPAFSSQGSPALLKSQVAVSDDGRFVGIENNTAKSFTVYDLSTCNGIVNNLRPQNCQSYDYWPFVSHQISSLQSIQHVRFLNGGLVSFEAVSSNPAVSGVYELAPNGNIDHLTDYIGLGDSYTSGEGAFGYLAGTDTANNKCHLSAHSYPLLLTRDLFSAAGGHSVACSGAVINDLASTSDNYRGQVKNSASLEELKTGQSGGLSNILANFSPGYIAQHLFVKQYQPRAVTVSIGGNDIGFGDLLQNCVEPHISRHTSDSTCYNTYESRQEVVQLVDRTVPRWTALYQELATEDPGVQIYAIGYPSIASDTGSCGLNVNLGKSELEFAEELIHYLNGAIQQAASSANVPYVDISQALAGHRLCEASGSSVAVNGLTAGNDNGVFGINVLGRESYHPNALGHNLIEQTILRQTANLISGIPAVPTNTDNQNLLNAPKSGRSINHLVPDDNLIAPVIHIGSGTVQIDGMRDGLKPNSTYTIRLDGPTGPVLTTTISTLNGDLSTSITVPVTTTPGDHTIDVMGSNQAGEPVDVTQPVYIASDDNDNDGDDIANGADSCPYAVNSGQDTDNDGVDDVCDPVIGQSPENTVDIGQSVNNPENPHGGKQDPPMSPNTPNDGLGVGANLPGPSPQPATQITTSTASISPMVLLTNTRLAASTPKNNSSSVPIRLTATVLPTKPASLLPTFAAHHGILGQTISQQPAKHAVVRHLAFRRCLEVLGLGWLIILFLVACSACATRHKRQAELS